MDIGPQGVQQRRNIGNIIVVSGQGNRHIVLRKGGLHIGGRVRIHKHHGLKRSVTVLLLANQIAKINIQQPFRQMSRGPEGLYGIIRHIHFFAAGIQNIK